MILNIIAEMMDDNSVYVTFNVGQGEENRGFDSLPAARKFMASLIQGWGRSEDTN